MPTITCRRVTPQAVPSLSIPQPWTIVIFLPILASLGRVTAINRQRNTSNPSSLLTCQENSRPNDILWNTDSMKRVSFPNAFEIVQIRYGILKDRSLRV
jgi:hypothetical protein